MLQWEDDSPIMGLKGYPKGWVMEVQLEEEASVVWAWREGYLAFTETIPPPPRVPEPLLLNLGIEKGLGSRLLCCTWENQPIPGEHQGPPLSSSNLLPPPARKALLYTQFLEPCFGWHFTWQRITGCLVTGLLLYYLTAVWLDDEGAQIFQVLALCQASNMNSNFKARDGRGTSGSISA